MIHQASIETTGLCKNDNKITMHLYTVQCIIGFFLPSEAAAIMNQEVRAFGTFLIQLPCVYNKHCNQLKTFQAINSQLRLAS